MEERKEAIRLVKVVTLTEGEEVSPWVWWGEVATSQLMRIGSGGLLG